MSAANIQQPTKESPAVWAFFQLTYTCLPLIILGTALLLFDQTSGFFARLDVAFIALIFIADALRDAFELNRIQSLGNLAGQSWVIYLIILFALTCLPIFGLIGIESGKLQIDRSVTSGLSVAMLLINAVVCFGMKYALKRRLSKVGL